MAWRKNTQSSFSIFHITKKSSLTMSMVKQYLIITIYTTLERLDVIAALQSIWIYGKNMIKQTTYIHGGQNPNNEFRIPLHPLITLPSPREKGIMLWLLSLVNH